MSFHSDREGVFVCVEESDERWKKSEELRVRVRIRREGGGGESQSINQWLHDSAATARLLGSVGVISFIDLWEC